MSNTGEALCGRLAVVTGGGGGIGGAVCHLLAEKGARVIVAGRTLETLEAVTAVLPARIPLDGISSVEQYSSLEHCVRGTSTTKPYKWTLVTATSVQNLFDNVKKLSQVPVSIVVNCVGHVDVQQPTAAETTENSFDRMVRVNFKGPFLVCRAAARVMLQASVTDGAIVNVSSRAANDCLTGFSVYSACKAAVVSFTRCMAAELAKRHIRCNAVLPGLTETPPVLRMGDQRRNALCATIPVGRLASTREIAQVVAFLCSPESSYVVGAAWVVAGGKQ
nr:estradiol 17-beta-dehydrogenase 8-like [Rhipicephalus microplus]